MKRPVLLAVATVALIVALGLLYGACGAANMEGYTSWSDPTPRKATAGAILCGMVSLIAFAAASRSKNR